MRTLFIPLMTVLAMLAPSTALAQASTCALNTVSQGSASVNYDPFGTSNTSVVNGQVELARLNLGGGDKTEEINFFITNLADSSLNGITITPISAVGGSGSASAGNGTNIFRNYPASVGGLPAAITSSPPAGLYWFKFGGNAPSKDKFVLSYNMTIPPNLNIPASISLPVAIVARCASTGNSTTTGIQTGAIVINVRILSALQASYAGSALNFGEVGNKTTAEVLAAPAAYSTNPNNYVRVASSGPYSVELSSPNAYRLLFAGGSPATANQRLQYSIKFLGQTLTTAAPMFTPVTCARGELNAAAGQLKIQARLLEGGEGKQVASYDEVLTVTVTPLAATTAVAQQSCSTLSGNF